MSHGSGPSTETETEGLAGACGPSWRLRPPSSERCRLAMSEGLSREPLPLALRRRESLRAGGGGGFLVFLSEMLRLRERSPKCRHPSPSARPAGEDGSFR